MTIYTIPQKQSGTGNIHDIASDMYDREIRFPKSCIFAVVLSSYYGGKGYTTHKSVEATVAASKREESSHSIIDARGNEYYVNGNELYAID